MSGSPELLNLFASQAAAPIVDRSEMAMVTPGGNVIPANTPADKVAGMDKEIGIAGKEAMKKQQSPNNIGAMLMAGQLLTPKQEQAPMPSFGRVSPAQAFNVTDPVASLLAPKRKKERPMISLL